MSDVKRWSWSGENWLFDDHDDLVLWYTTQDDGLHGYQEDKSIIAAAPDMLEAGRKLANEVAGLKAFEHELRAVIGNTNWSVLMQRMAEAEAAISKAKG